MNAKDTGHPLEGACGICHAVAEKVCRAGGRIVTFEQPGGILVRIAFEVNLKSNVIGMAHSWMSRDPMPSTLVKDRHVE